MAEALGETNRVLAEILSEIKTLNHSLKSHNERIDDLERSLKSNHGIEKPSPLDELKPERTHQESSQSKVVPTSSMSSILQ